MARDDDELDHEIQKALSEYDKILEKKPDLDKAKKLQEIKEKIIDSLPSISDRGKEIEKSLLDKAVLRQDDFFAKAEKQAGVSAGYIATDKDDNTFILKQFYKDPDDCSITDPKRQDFANRRDGVNELVGGTMYQLLLYDRAPKEQLVIPDAANQDSLYVRSKFFEHSQQLAQFAPGRSTTSINHDNPKLKELKGFEKVIAASHMLGELDYHAGNIMVTPDNTAVKIDHGRSFMEFHKDLASMAKATHETFSSSGVGYTSAIDKGNLSFDPTKYSDALKQMTSQLNYDQIDAIVDQKIDELKKAGLNPEGIDIWPGGKRKYVKNFEDLRKFYTDGIKENRQNMEKIAQDVEIIAKFEFPDKDKEARFKQGGWLKDSADTQDGPIALAAKLGATIEGKDPLEFAIEKGMQITKKDPIEWAVEKGIQIEKISPIAWAAFNDKDIENTDPIIWALKNGKQIEEKDPMAWAIVNGIRINGLDVLQVAAETNAPIEGKNPIAWAIENKYQIEGKDPSEWGKQYKLKLEAEQIGKEMRNIQSERSDASHFTASFRSSTQSLTR